MSSLLHDARTARNALSLLTKRAFSPTAPAKPLGQTMADAAGAVRGAGTAARAAVGSAAARTARTVGGGLAVMQTVDSVPNVVAKGARDYNDILGSYYQQGGGR